MATSIPPHNLGEVADGSDCLHAESEDITTEGMMEYIHGSGFPDRRYRYQ